VNFAKRYPGSIYPRIKKVVDPANMTPELLALAALRDSGGEPDGVDSTGEETFF
jgi:hypothetical protein